MTDFLLSQQDYITFFYGTALIILSAACFVVRRREEGALPWFFLGTFALMHGAYEWLEIFVPLLGKSLFLEIFRSLLAVPSFFFLFEFGRRGLSQDGGKAPGRIYIPLFSLCVLGGIAAGWDGFIDASRYALGFPGGFLSAIVLFKASRRHRALPRNLLLAGGLMMACYAVAGILSIKLPYPGFSLLNADSLLPGLRVTITLQKGLLSLGMAFIVSLYSQMLAPVNELLDYFRGRSRYVFWISVLAMMAILAVGWMTTQYFGNRARDDIETVAHSHAEALESQKFSFATITDQDVRAMAEAPGMAPALTSRGKDLEGANIATSFYKLMRGAEIAYLLDGEGKVIASSDHNLPDSIIGQDFSRQPYVKQALSDMAGQYLAVGFATESPGYFASHPVYDKERQVIGVAVIKKNLTDLEADFGRQLGLAFLISPEGIIFLSSRPQLDLMNLWPLRRDVAEKLSSSRQFGAGPFKALLPAEPENNREVPFEGKSYLVTRKIIDSEGWSIVLFSPTDQVIFSRLIGILIALALSVLTISFFVGFERSLGDAARIALSENRFRAVFESAPVAIFIIGKDRLLSVNRFMSEWLGYSQSEMLSLTLNDIRVAEGEAPGECQYRRRDGTVMYVEEVRKGITFHGQVAELIIVHDISARKKSGDFLYTLSRRDGLTGIANRRRFDEFLEQEWRRSMRDGAMISLIMCDIDFFKLYNDTYGHQAGDDCLRQVAGVIADALHRPGDLASRYGGEEFAMILSETDWEGALLLAESVRREIEALGIPHRESSLSSLVTLSLGVAAISPTKGIVPAELIQAADHALYQAKQEGRNCVRAHKSP